MAEGTVTRPDGRTVAYATWGDPDGRPLLQIHGTPGSRLSRSPHPDEYVRAGAHVVTFDRPGYGQSSPWRDRTVLDIADDALAVADALGWERFSVLGISGGGPHALALGVRAPERIVRLGVAVGGTPGELHRPRRPDRAQPRRACAACARRAARASRSSWPRSPRRSPPTRWRAFDAAMADAPEPDREWMARPEVRETLVEGIREGFANGPLGLVRRRVGAQHRLGLRARRRRARRSGSGTASSTATSRSAPSGR